MEVFAEIEALSLDPSTTIIQNEVKRIGALSALSYPFWIDGTDDTSFSEGLNLSVTHCVVPPQARVFLVVSVSIDCDFDPGRAVADLESGTFGVRCPLVVVSVRGKPPPSILG
jgi:hypothetical protein